MPRKVDN
jgi:hypothetical protein